MGANNTRIIAVTNENGVGRENQNQRKHNGQA